MKVVVIGGTGLIGSRLVNLLAEQGHSAVAASPRLGINTITAEGLTEALEGSSVVVDVTNARVSGEEAVTDFFQTSTCNLLAAEANAGVGHHLVLSIVGVDRAPINGYYRAKRAQEQVIEAGIIPFTIVRATQFFEFIDGITNGSTHGNDVRVPPIAFQPIAAADVTRLLADVATHSPLNAVLEIAGPDRLRFDDVIKRRLESRNDSRRVIADPHAAYFGAVPNELSLVPLGAATLGAIRFEDWLRG